MGGAQDEEDNNFMDTNYKVGFWQIYLLGVAMVLTGPFSDWNHGFIAGFGGYMVIYTIVVLGYTSLVFCLAEMTSTVAFASGTYGYVRCTIGPLYGFLVGCCELIENNFITLCCVYTIALSMTAVTEMDRNYEPLWMFLTYAAAVFVLLPGGHYLWRFMYVLCAFTLTALYLYLFTVWTTQPKMWSADLTHAAHNKIAGSATTVLQQLFRPNWFYIGFEVITVTGKNMSDGTKVLPRVLLAVFFTVAITCTLIVFTTAAYFQDLLGEISWADIALTVFAPLTYGYQNGLGMSPKGIYAFTIISTFGSVLGFHYTSTQLMQAMALSGLLPPVLKRWSGPNKVPVNALLCSTFIQYTVLVIGWSVSLAPPFFTLCILSSCVVYFGAFGAFLSFRYRFGHMTRLFTSPFGVGGGVFGFMLFLFMFFVVAVVNAEDLAIYYFIGYMVACLVYYIVYAEKNQFFSPEEQKRFLKAYILNAKTKKASNYTIMESIYLAFNCLALREASSLNSRSRNTGSSATTAASKNKSAVAAASMRAVAKKDDESAAPSPSKPTVAKLNSVAPAETVESPPVAMASGSARPMGSARASNKVVSFANEEKNHDGSSPSRRLTWSGKVLDNAESVKFLTMMTSTKNKEDVLSAFPDLLIPSTTQREVEEELV